LSRFLFSTLVLLHAREWWSYTHNVSPLSLAVVLCTRNRGQVLLDALGDVLAQAPKTAEVLVVEQSDHDVYTSVASAVEDASDPRLELIRAKPLGLPHARNVGIRRTTADVLLFLDDDVRLAPGCLEAHLDAYRREGAGGVVGRIDEEIPMTNHPKLANRIGPGGRVLTNLESNVRGEVETLKGANMSFRRKALDVVGVFDENYRGTFLLEDADMSTRVRESGWELWFEPAARLRHLSTPSGGVRQRSALQTARWRFHNTGYFMRKHRGRRSWPQLNATFMAIALKRATQWSDPEVVPVLMGALRDGWKLGR
jgi:GT2 family glycosyltransferase